MIASAAMPGMLLNPAQFTRATRACVLSSTAPRAHTPCRTQGRSADRRRPPMTVCSSLDKCLEQASQRYPAWASIAALVRKPRGQQ